MHVKIHGKELQKHAIHSGWILLREGYGLRVSPID